MSQENTSLLQENILPAPPSSLKSVHTAQEYLLPETALNPNVYGAHNDGTPNTATLEDVTLDVRPASYPLLRAYDPSKMVDRANVKKVVDIVHKALKGEMPSHENIYIVASATYRAIKKMALPYEQRKLLLVEAILFVLAEYTDKNCVLMEELAHITRDELPYIVDGFAALIAKSKKWCCPL